MKGRKKKGKGRASNRQRGRLLPAAQPASWHATCAGTSRSSLLANFARLRRRQASFFFTRELKFWEIFELRFNFRYVESLCLMRAVCAQCVLFEFKKKRCSKKTWILSLEISCWKWCVLGRHFFELKFSKKRVICRFNCWVSCFLIRKKMIKLNEFLLWKLHVETYVFGQHFSSKSWKNKRVFCRFNFWELNFHTMTNFQCSILPLNQRFR